MLQVKAEARYTALDVLAHPWVTVSCFNEDVVAENNMKMEVSGKLKTHFNPAPKHNPTTAGVSVIMNTALDKEAFTINCRPLSKGPAPSSDAEKLEKPNLKPKPGPALTTNTSQSDLSTNQSSLSTPVTPPLLLSPSSEPIICLPASLSSQTIASPTKDAPYCSPSPVSPVQPAVFFPQAPPSPHHAPPTLFPSPPSTPPRSDPPSPISLQELSEAM